MYVNGGYRPSIDESGNTFFQTPKDPLVLSA